MSEVKAEYCVDDNRATGDVQPISDQAWLPNSLNINVPVLDACDQRLGDPRDADALSALQVMRVLEASLRPQDGVLIRKLPGQAWMCEVTFASVGDWGRDLVQEGRGPTLHEAVAQAWRALACAGRP